MFTRRKFLLFIFALAAVLILALTGTVFGALNNTYAGHPVAKVLINGTEINDDVPAVVINGRVMVPLRVVSEALGAEVEWDEANYTANITTTEVLAAEQDAQDAQDARPERWPVVQSNVRNDLEVIGLGVDWNGRAWKAEGEVRNNSSDVVYCGAKLNNITRDGIKEEVDFIFVEPSFLGPGDVGMFKFMIAQEIVEKNHVFEIEFLWARQE